MGMALALRLSSIQASGAGTFGLPVTNVVAAQTGGTVDDWTVQITFNAPGGPVPIGYELEESKDGGAYTSNATTPTGTTYTLTNVGNGFWRWRIRAVYPEGNSAWSFSNILQLAPAAPENIDISILGPEGPNEWLIDIFVDEYSVVADSYHLEISYNGGAFAPATGVLEEELSGGRYRWALGQQPDGDYLYRAYVILGGDQSFFVVSDMLDLVVLPPVNPIASAVPNGSNYDITLDWDAPAVHPIVSAVYTYQMQVSYNDGPFVNTTPSSIAVVTQITFTNQPPGTYLYRVRTNAGNITDWVEAPRISVPSILPVGILSSVY